MISSLLGKLVEQKRENVTVWALLAVNFCIRCIVAARPLEYLDGLTIPDDAYLSLTIARNIAKGLGPLYGFEYTNGFQPLYVFLMVPTFMLVPDDVFASVRIALFLLIIFDTLTLYLVYRYATMLSKSSLTPILTAIAWICSPYIISNTLNGLETSISVFFIIASLFWFHIISHKRHEHLTFKHYLLLGVLLGFAIFARIDNVLLALSIVLVFCWQLPKQESSHVVRMLLPAAVGCAVVLLPWFLYSYHYTGDFYPVSGKAVRFNSLWDVQHNPTFENHYLRMIIRAFRVIVKRNWVHLSLIAAMLAFLFAQRTQTRNIIPQRLRPLLPALLYALALLAAYTGYIFTPWFFERYLYPVGIVILLIFAAVIDECVSGIPKSAERKVFVVVVFLILGLNIQQKYFRDLFFSTGTTTRGYMNLGLWAKKEFKEGTIIGAQQSGGLAYFADNLRVINLDGVVNKACYESLAAGRNMDYIRSLRIQYIIGWQVDRSYIIDHSANFQPDDLNLIRQIQGFTSWGQKWYLLKVSYK